MVELFAEVREPRDEHGEDHEQKAEQQRAHQVETEECLIHADEERVGRPGQDGRMGRVGLLGEPMHGIKDGRNARQPECDCGSEDGPVFAEQPSSAGNHDKGAKPCGLSGCSSDDAGEGCASQPGDGGTGREGGCGSLAAVQAEDNGEEAGNVRHITGCKGQEQRTEGECQRTEDCISAGDAKAEQDGVEEEEGKQGNGKDRQADVHIGGAEDPDEESAPGDEPADHGIGPSVVSDVASLREYLGGFEERPVIDEAHAGDRPGEPVAGKKDETAEEAVIEAGLSAGH